MVFLLRTINNQRFRVQAKILKKNFFLISQRSYKTVFWLQLLCCALQTFLHKIIEGQNAHEGPNACDQKIAFWALIPLIHPWWQSNWKLATYMPCMHKSNLNVFKEMFLMTNQVHIYNTRNLNTFYLFPAQTNMTFWHKISGSQIFQFSKSQYK